MVDSLNVSNAEDESPSLGVVYSPDDGGTFKVAISNQDARVSPSLNDIPKETFAIKSNDYEMPRHWLQRSTSLSLGSLLLTAKVTAKTLQVSGATDYNFLVMLPEQTNVDLTDLGTGEVLVTGPHGYCQAASFVAMRGHTICYRINAPDRIWTQADNGIYRIHVGCDEVGSPGMIQAFLVEISENIGDCLMQNGCFESGLTHWVTFAGTEQVVAEAYVGMAALVLSTMDSGTSQTVGVKPGAIYQLTGYGRSTCQDYSSFGMTFFDAKGSLLLRTDVGPIYATGWQDYFVVAIAPTNAAYVQVWTYQNSDQGTTHIDSLSLQQIHADNLPPVQVSRFSLINAPLAATDTTFLPVFNVEF